MITIVTSRRGNDGVAADPAALDTVARALKLPVGHTAPVQQGSKVQIGRLVVPDAGVWAFEAKPRATSSVIETPYAYYIFRLDSLQPEGVPPLTAIRSALIRAVREHHSERRRI